MSHRNLKKYETDYEDYLFEDIQVAYRKKKVLELIQSHKHRTILEIGCGLDPFFNCSDDFDNLVIIEPSAKFYENAINIVKNSSSLTSKVVVINDYMENATRELQKYDFDYVIISGLLHEIEDASSFLKDIHSITRKNTIVHIDVPNARSFHRVLAYEMGIIKSVFELSSSNLRLQQQTVFDIATLSELITNYGFKIINSGSYFLKPFAHKQMYELLNNKIIDENTLDGLYKMTKYVPDMGSEIFIEFKIDD